MKIGFIKTTSGGLSEAEQRSALEAVGITGLDNESAIFIDDREAAIDVLAAGDVFVVSDPGRVGSGAIDVMKALQEIAARGAAIMRADSGEVFSWSPDATRILNFTVEAAGQTRKEIAANARRVKAENNIPGGIPAFDWTPEIVAKLNGWIDEGIKTRQEMADELGVSRSTVQRKLAELKSA